MVCEQELIEIFRSKFKYFEGNLYWLTGPRKGKLAGYISKNGYNSVNINFGYKINKHYLMHRVIFAIHHGYLPSLVDHIDRNISNNRIENLREANKSINSINRGVPINNKSGIKGVTFHHGKWDVFVHIQQNGVRKKLNLGRFKDLEDAKNARENWERYNWSFV
jgi:hypothetical protein